MTTALFIPIALGMPFVVFVIIASKRKLSLSGRFVTLRMWLYPELDQLSCSKMDADVLLASSDLGSDPAQCAKN